MRFHQREYPCDKSNRGHQDWAKAKPACFNRRFERRFALVLLHLREFDDQNSVLAREADQDDKADLGENVVIAAADPDASDGEQQAHGYDQDDRERQAETFVLGGQDEEDQQDAERINVNGGITGQHLLIGELGPFGGHAFGQIFIDDF